MSRDAMPSSNRRARICAIALLLALQTPLGAQAHAQVGEAQALLEAGDVEAAQRVATRMIEEGSSEPEQLAQLRYVQGRCLAARGAAEQARDAFIVALAVDPSLRMGSDEPIELRSPYLEARGQWAGTAQRLAVDVEYDAGRSALRARAIDPGHLSVRYRLRARVGDGAWREIALSPSEEILMVLPDANPSDIHYSVALLDEFGNRILRRGSDAEPIALELRIETSAPTVPVALAPSADATPFHVAATSMGVLGAAALGGALALHLERERLAGVWNQDGCLGRAGLTRLEQCGDVDSSRLDAEVGAIALYALTGTLAIGTLAVLLGAPGASSRSDGEASESASSCDLGVGSVACQLLF